MRIPALSRTAATLASAAALISLTACGTDTGDERTADNSAPSQPVSASPAAEANGVEKLTAAEVYDTGKATIAAAGSFRERMSRQDAQSDLWISATECVGTVDLKKKGSFEIVRKGDDVWVKPDMTLAQQFSSQLDFYVSPGAWVHGTPDNELMKTIVSWCHHEQITAPDTLSASVKATKGKTTTEDGRQAVPVVLAANGDSVTWYVAAQGKPYLFKQESTRADMTDVMYSDFGKPVNAQAPSGQIEEVPAM
ncbi:hypothetical protein [Streptomyces mutabilis]|uniref:Lipoprotein n=1 Tax=Streptomyces mutabilis TaxID=67332 RepID=A0A086MR04_9ACTN|nr:hypothetical protein [Streptomyces mutabilis]KFG71322.1 hypothetical protein FM21_33970 [Streptomyces mutabilis]